MLPRLARGRARRQAGHVSGAFGQANPLGPQAGGMPRLVRIEYVPVITLE